MNCHCCGNEYTLLNSTRARRHRSYLYKCEACGHRYHNYRGNITMFHKSVYRRKVSSGRMSNHDVVDGKIFPEKFHKVRRNLNLDRIKKISNLITKETELLDIGAGGCSFALKVKGLVRDVECTEVNRIGIRECERLGFKTYTSEFFSKLRTDKKYDLITSWHVLEHVRNIKAFINACHRLSKGIVVLEVPSKRAIANIFNGHLHYFTKESIKLLCEEKFNILSIEEGVQSPAILIKLEKKRK